MSIALAGEIWRAEAYVGDVLYPQVIVADAPAYNITRSDIIGTFYWRAKDSLDVCARGLF